MPHRPEHLYFGQILIHLDIATHKEIMAARRIQLNKQPEKPIGEIMIELGYINEGDLQRALSLQRDITDSEVF